MARITAYFTILFFLLLATVNAQSSELAPSCKSSQRMKLTFTFKLIEMETDNWCWAATAQNIMGYHDKKFANTRQCQLVEDVSSFDPCCDSSATPECKNMGGSPEMIFKNKRFTYAPPRIATDKILNWTEATNEICEGRPYHAFIYWDGVNPHSVVVIGYDTTSGVDEIIVFDPTPHNGEAWLPFDQFILEDIESANQLYTHHRDTYQILPPN